MRKKTIYQQLSQLEFPIKGLNAAQIRALKERLNSKQSLTHENSIITFLCKINQYLLLPALAWLAVDLILIQRSDLQGFVLFNSINNKLIDYSILWLTELSGGYVISFVLINASSTSANTLFAIFLTFVCWYVTTATKYNHFSDWKSPFVMLKAQIRHILGNHQLQLELNFPSSHTVIAGCALLYTGWLARKSKLVKLKP